MNVMRIVHLLSCLLLAASTTLAAASGESATPPLIAALQARDAAAFERLVEAGADVSATDAWGRTPLLVATQMRDNAAVRRLLDRNAGVDAANRNDITPLIAAAQAGNLEAVRMLLQAGADPARRDNLGLTALDWAQRRKEEAIAQLLATQAARTAPEAVAAPRTASASRQASPRFDPRRAVRGDPAAPVTIFEYTDFQCPYCAHGARVMEEVMARYPGRVRLVVKHLPLPLLHPMAMRSAQYFEALALQNPAAAWLFYDRVFRTQAALSHGEAHLRKLAAECGADMTRLDADLRDPEVDRRIAADLRESREYRFHGVPAFVVNGRVIEGAQPAQRFFEIVEAPAAGG